MFDGGITGMFAAGVAGADRDWWNIAPGAI